MSKPTQHACAVTNETGHICKRQAAHPGVHEHYENGQTISWRNASGWFVTTDVDDDGRYWYLKNYHGNFTGAEADRDDRKFDTPAAAEAACEIMNRRAE